MLLRNLVRIGLLGIGLVAPQLTFADSLIASQILSQFNAVVTNNFSTVSDVEGRLVAGTINSPGGGNYYIAPSPLQQSSTFQAINALNIDSCPNCNVDHGGSVNWVKTLGPDPPVHFNLNGGGSLMQNNPSFAMSDFAAPLNALEAHLSTLTSNSIFTFAGTDLTFNVTPVKGVAVFDIPVTDLMKATNISFSGFSTSDTIIVNVTGASGFSFNQSGINFNLSGTTACPGSGSGNTTSCFNNRTIWNFQNAGSLHLGHWHGSLPAGEADVTNFSPIEGLLYAENFTAMANCTAFLSLARFPRLRLFPSLRPGRCWRSASPGSALWI